MLQPSWSCAGGLIVTGSNTADTSDLGPPPTKGPATREGALLELQPLTTLGDGGEALDRNRFWHPHLTSRALRIEAGAPLLRVLRLAVEQVRGPLDDARGIKALVGE